MKSLSLMALLMGFIFMAKAQKLDTSSLKADELVAEEEDLSPAALKQYSDSINASFTYKTGKIELGDGAVLNVPKGFRYLDPAQSHRLLEEVWGNPPGSETLGMLLPDSLGPADPTCYAFDIAFEKMGYVKDEDADKIDYDELLKDLQKETKERNPDRLKQGYPAIEFVGWAAKPYYDKANKTLHWARELEFGGSPEHTLNYNVRILGRKGVLSLNAIGDMTHLGVIKQNIPAILQSATFSEGHAYADFDSNADEIAAVTIGGLVAGKVLAKVGFFAIILKFGKVIVFGLIGAGAAVWKFITGRRRRKEEEEAVPEEAPIAEINEPEQPAS
ncbi:DUF2167 domain-containing protein [Chitinophaga sp. SYP-B3965]|uniref:DUF2167 domain-containing protein n=1 Tax=Chitinophaga sp. SYP-B3965 TaxID=2663120 RepID=UPI001299F42A|nr:DUF2167 domain-containing protein [Chitinophaga sp. SYP-B3965]MRG45601.1 DUF2167 domain-containing protein [Chitinophaga sp. SYP-B3965]